MKFALIYNQFYSSDGKVVKIGGIETYMRYLAKLLLKLNHFPIIFQLSDYDFIKTYEGIGVHGYNCKDVKSLYLKAKSDIGSDGIIVFMGDQFSVDIKNNQRSILIQHGISWDKPYKSGIECINFVKRLRMIYRAIRDFNHTRNRVCVDYNFYNWYKTFCFNFLPQNIWIIPNFVENILSDEEILNKISTRNMRINIIFARRLYDYRGCFIFTKAMQNILNTEPNVYLTIAGEGPCEVEMRNMLKHFEHVNFVRYLPEESFDIHKDKDIAVVPTIGSEGTSLSLLEAMGAGCLVVSTPVGGMSNIIIDGFNGIFCMPNELDLELAIRKAISKLDDKEIRMNSLKTVRTAFSLERWESAWTNVINNVITK